MLTAEQLLEVGESLTCTGAIYRYRMRLAEHLAGLIELLAGIEDLGTVGKSIGGCIDGRGHVLDMASRELAAVRQKLFDLDEKVKAEIRRLLRDPELRRILSYPERDRSRRPLRPARRGQPPAQGPGRRPPRQRHRRDGVHRAGEHRRPERRAGGAEGRRGPRGEARPPPAERRGGPGREAARATPST